MRSPLSAVLDAAESRGTLNLRTADIAQALPGVSADALRQALRRQQRKGRIVSASRGAQHWVIVPLHITIVRKKLKLGQREAAEVFGGGVNAFSRYETGKTKPALAVVKLLKVLDRHPELLDEIRAG